jgi:hypothetical protein
MAQPEDPVPERTELLSVTVGMVWREARVSCPHRDILRAYREGGLPTGAADYVRFHVAEAECAYCQAQLDDLARDDAATTEVHLHGLKDRLLSSTMSLLRQKRRG